MLKINNLLVNIDLNCENEPLLKEIQINSQGDINLGESKALNDDNKSAIKREESQQSSNNNNQRLMSIEEDDYPYKNDFTQKVNKPVSNPPNTN